MCHFAITKLKIIESCKIKLSAQKERISAARKVNSVICVCLKSHETISFGILTKFIEVYRPFAAFLSLSEIAIPSPSSVGAQTTTILRPC